MIIPNKQSPEAEKNQCKLKIARVLDFLLLTEPIWVSIAASFVYVSLIFNWASTISWLSITLSLSPFLLRVIRHGRPSRHTPFDIPIAILLGGMITGMTVSDDFDMSLGVFQTFLAATAFYYSATNYSRPSRLVVMFLIISAGLVIVVSVLAVKWKLADISKPHSLDIIMMIIVAIFLGISIFARQNIHRLGGVLLFIIILGVVIFYSDESLQRFYTLESFEGRMRLWLDVISPMKGSQIWAGLGLGYWPIAHIQEHYWMGHVHNAYLELYINTGIIGLIAFFSFLAVGAKLASEILYSPKNNFFYGFGVGVILASLALLAVSFVESAAFGFGFLYKGSYVYIFTPLSFILAGAIVIAWRLLREDSTFEYTESAESFNR